MQSFNEKAQLKVLGLAMATTLAVGAIACTGGVPGAKSASSTGADLPTEVKIVATDFKYEPATLQIPAGKPVKVTLENKGHVEHDIAIPALNFKLVAKAGQKAESTVTAEQGGDFDIECTLPGHKDAGMVGHMAVVGGQAAPKVAKPIDNASTTTASAAEAPKPMPAGLTRLPAPQVAPPVNRSEPALVKIEIESKEIEAVMDDGVAYKFWTFNGTVPGPMVRVRQGDTVELTFKNAPDSQLTHSIDLHAVTGPGGGAKATQAAPGETAVFRFQATNPGTYVYHCATPMVAHHIASGMYGLIVVEPPQGFAPVDHEYYVMQGDFYLKGQRGTQGLRDFAMDKMLDERPDFVLFNGSVGALTGENTLKAKVGETVRIFFGVGGPNLTSSFHVIGEIFDRVYAEGAAEPQTHVQTTMVPAGGSTVVEFKLQVPGKFTLVDHSLGRLEKGAAGVLEVTGDDNPEVFQVLQLPNPTAAQSSGH